MIMACVGNYDYPELPITGLKFALEHAAKNSLAYVFTDALAKDYELFKEVLPTIQKKQVKVNFMLSGDTAAQKTDVKYQVYDDIAIASEGQVFDLSRDIIKDVMLAITQGLDSKFESVESLNFKTAGSTTKPLKVDQSFSSVSVSLAGKNSKLTVKNDKNEDVKSRASFSSANIKFMTFDVTNSSYTIIASAESAFSIRVGGISELKFEFGFSTYFATEQSETSIRPLVGHKNILSIFISDASLVKCLTHAFILPANENEAFPELKISFERGTGNLFASDPFEIPTKMFKIRIHGYDKKGNIIERLISSGIESVTGSE